LPGWYSADNQMLLTNVSLSNTDYYVASRNLELIPKAANSVAS